MKLITILYFLCVFSTQATFSQNLTSYKANRIYFPFELNADSIEVAGNCIWRIKDSTLIITPTGTTAISYSVNSITTTKQVQNNPLINNEWYKYKSYQIPTPLTAKEYRIAQQFFGLKMLNKKFTETSNLTLAQDSVSFLFFTKNGCPPCQALAPQLQNLQKAFYQKRVKFYSVHYEQENTKDSLMGFNRIIMNRKNQNSIFITSYPTVFIIDKSGIVKDIYIGLNSQNGNYEFENMSIKINHLLSN